MRAMSLGVMDETGRAPSASMRRLLVAVMVCRPRVPALRVRLEPRLDSLLNRRRFGSGLQRLRHVVAQKRQRLRRRGLLGLAAGDDLALLRHGIVVGQLPRRAVRRGADEARSTI